MNNVQPIKLSDEQRQRLENLVSALIPNVKYVQSQSNSTTIYIKFEYEERGIFISWLELCLLHFISPIAELYVKHHMDCTENWAKRMILQKVSHEIYENNPIDILYSIWTEPSLYKQGL